MVWIMTEFPEEMSDLCSSSVIMSGKQICSTSIFCKDTLQPMLRLCDTQIQTYWKRNQRAYLKTECVYMGILHSFDLNTIIRIQSISCRKSDIFIRSFFFNESTFSLNLMINLNFWMSTTDSRNTTHISKDKHITEFAVISIMWFHWNRAGYIKYTYLQISL